LVVRLVQYGIGAIGAAIAAQVVRDPAFALVAAFDADPAKVGRDVGEVAGVGRLGVAIAPPAAGQWPDADVMLHTTGSFLATVAPQLEEGLSRGLNVVSSCEELAFPTPANRPAAERLDRLARERGVTLLGTGVNPGFVMDTLAVALSAVACRVDSLRITRVVDATDRRLPFQRKIGAGLDRAAFEAAAATGTFGHIGLLESALSVAAALGWEPNAVRRSLEPVFADRDLASPRLGVRKGDVAGIHESLRLSHGGREVLAMELVMAMGAADARDEIEIRGDPPLRSVIPGGVQGDRATVGIMLNAARAVGAAPAGLLTMRDLPPVHWRATP
jgi:4-hydroxy-tetrahydrodipicolinate reductase